jgi:redox-sensitive bicupin YhaK (pirin superfamily)
VAGGELVRSEHFTVMHRTGTDATEDRDRFVLPLAGRVESGGDSAAPGDCLYVPAGERLVASADARLLLAVPA